MPSEVTHAVECSHIDIDECSLAEKPCLRDNENCYNTPGSFVCVCPDGFEEAEDTCVQTGPAGAGEDTSATSACTWPGAGGGSCSVGGPLRDEHAGGGRGVP